MANFSSITELPESKVLPIQVERSYSRYKFGSLYCESKDVLEIACGGGQGLGLIAKTAKSVVGSDYEISNIETAKKTFSGLPNIQLNQFDAHNIPYPENSFDVILIYEAIYYLKDVTKFLQECYRVLRSNGKLIICTANKDWPDFNPSPFSYTYFSIPELNKILSENGFSSNFFGAFPDIQHGIRDKVISFIKRIAVKLHLMPKTMKGKVLLKKLFFGGLCHMPAEFKEGCAPYTPPISIPSDKQDKIHTALYAVATKLN